jgi:hypothetical protein
VRRTTAPPDSGRWRTPAAGPYGGISCFGAIGRHCRLDPVWRQHPLVFTGLSRSDRPHFWSLHASKLVARTMRKSQEFRGFADTSAVARGKSIRYAGSYTALKLCRLIYGSQTGRVGPPSAIDPVTRFIYMAEARAWEDLDTDTRSIMRHWVQGATTRCIASAYCPAIKRGDRSPLLKRSLKDQMGSRDTASGLRSRPTIVTACDIAR